MTAELDDGGTDAPVNPILRGIEATDAAGVPLWHYQHLPLDRGGVLDGHSTMTAWLTDALWAGHLGLLAVTLQLLEWVLTFGWIEWLLGPIDAVRRVAVEAIGDLAWAPLALLITAIVAGILAFRGRIGAAVLQLTVSVGCFALASTVMTAPLTALTGTDDPVPQAREIGTALSAAVIADVLGEDEATTASGNHIIDRVQSRMITLLVRGAAQEIAFGQNLAGTTCDDAFTAAMLDEAPGPDRSGVREAVSACSDAAAAYVEQPSLWQPLSLLITMAGALALMAFVLSLAGALVAAVLGVGVASLRAMIWVNIAIMPGIGRQRFGRAVADVFMSLVAVIGLLVAVSVACALIVRVAEEAASSGASLTVQMAVVALCATLATIGIATIRARLRAAGRDAVGSLRSFARTPPIHDDRRS